MSTESQHAFELCRENLLRAPGMIEESERRLLFKAAYSCTDLPVVEFGTFFGASALALASGLASKGLNPNQVICIDAFKVSKDHGLYRHVISFAQSYNATGLLLQDDREVNWLKITQAVLGEHLERTRLISGIVNHDFNMNFLPEIIGLLHLDLPKDARTIEPILKSVFPKLATNSIIAFQDYAYQFSNELIAYFELLEQNGHVKTIAIAASTVFYRVKSQNPASIDWASLLLNSLKNQTNLITRAIKRYEENKSHRSTELVALRAAAIRSEAANKSSVRLDKQIFIQRYIQEMIRINLSHSSLVLAELFTEELVEHF